MCVGELPRRVFGVWSKARRIRQGLESGEKGLKVVWKEEIVRMGRTIVAVFSARQGGIYV